MSKNKITIDNCAVILPSLNPTDKLTGVVNSVIAAGFSHVIVVDDGSAAEHQAPFEELSALPQVTLLRHEVNRGKGAALKTAFTYLKDKRPDILGAVTADGDGQHLAKDMLRCAQALGEKPNMLVMGCRNFNLPEVPPKSKNGNKIASFISRTGCGIRPSDTQTGLRAVAADYFPRLLDISGERYEYETNMLLAFHKAGIRFLEVEIETVYEDNNSGSHFRPIVDSFRIYKLIFKYMLSSVASSLIDLGVFWLLHFVIEHFFPGYAATVTICTVVARAISSFVNFNMNKKLVFGSGGNYGKAMLRYYILCVVQLCCSAGLVSLLDMLLKPDTSIVLTLIKAVVDTCLFFISFNIQREWVFKDK